jgi:uncharacterized membrane protein YhfC
MDAAALVRFLNGFLMMAMPVGLAIVLVKQLRFGWQIWWIGFATFLISQAGHLPFNWIAGMILNHTRLVLWTPTQQLLFNAVFLGLSAGLFEEGSRYLVLRFWAKSARSWRSAILFGAGHGGAEAFLLGAYVMYVFVEMVAVRNADLARLVSGANLSVAQQQVAAYWSAPWYLALLGALERLFTLPCQIALAVIVMQAFTRRQPAWLLLAIGYHALIDGSSVVSSHYFGDWTELQIGCFAVISILVIYLLRQPEPAQAVNVPESAVRNPTILPPEESVENLDGTRYQ